MQKFENNFLVVNVSDNKENYSQRNNTYIHKNNKGVTDVSASTMCNVTSICQALDYNGWKFPNLGKFKQPEDALADFILKSPEVDQFYKTKMPELYKDYREGKLDKNKKPAYYTPNELHACLAYGTNLWLGCTNAVTFKDSCSIFDIVKELIEGRACVVSGNFNGFGHIVTLVGARWNYKDTKGKTPAQALKEIIDKKILPTSWIIDDPYGDFRQKYKVGVSGNDVIMTADQFYSMLKPLNNSAVKWCHIIKSGAAVA